MVTFHRNIPCREQLFPHLAFLSNYHNFSNFLHLFHYFSNASFSLLSISFIIFFALPLSQPVLLSVGPPCPLNPLPLCCNLTGPSVPLLQQLSDPVLMQLKDLFPLSLFPHFLLINPISWFLGHKQNSDSIEFTLQLWALQGLLIDHFAV